MPNLRRTVTAGFMLGVFLLLNLAVVLPALHALWHDGHGCDEPDCVVVALAQGKADPVLFRVTVPEPVELESAAATPVVACQVIRADCPPLPGRAPPV